MNFKTKKMSKGFAITLAWPETLCKQAGGWYDSLLHYLGISREGYYRVGHSAMILVDDKTQQCQYFDFGRYHSPHGYGRVRNVKTDHDLHIETKAFINNDRTGITNLSEILLELYSNSSTHGTGEIYGAVTRINFNKAHALAMKMQKKKFISYGPFLPNGTNCSRFVSSVLQVGSLKLLQKIKLRFPLTLSPTPMRSEEHTSELQSHSFISYAVFCLKKKKQ